MTFVLVSIVSMLIMLGILVLVHEFGHFAVAKLCGVRVEVFSIGMGTRLFGYKHGDTDYRISLLPIGGYVKMAGELPTEKASGDPGEYSSHPRWQRILILCAGPAANFLLALLLLTVVYMGHNEVPNYISQPAVVDYVQPGSPAANAGLQHGDRIVRFDSIQNPDWQTINLRSVMNLNHSVSIVVEQNGQQKQSALHLPAEPNPNDFSLRDVGFTLVEQSAPLKITTLIPDMPGAKAGLKVGDAIESVDGISLHSLQSMILYLRQNGNRPVTLTVLRNGQPLEFNVTPEKGAEPDGTPAFQIGFNVEPPPSHIERLSLPQAFSQSVRDNIKGTTLVADVLHRLVTARMSVRTLSGPVGIARMTGQVASLPGWAPLMEWTANISLQLGLLNLLPIPILDGGTILFLIIESIMRHDLNEQFKERVFQAAFVFLILMTVFILVSDLSKIPAISHLRL
jgi:regulator of sigma E protease